MDNKKGGAAKKLRILILIVILLCAAIYALSDFLIDWMWFDEMGYVSVFFTELFTKLKLGGPMFAATTLIALLFLMTMKKRFLKKNEMTIDDKSSKRSIRLAGIGLSVFFGVLTTLRIISKLWFQILQLMNATEFGVTDPLFGNDVSFYVFKLEFWEEVCSSLTGLLIALFIITVVYHAILVAIAKPEQTEGDFSSEFTADTEEDAGEGSASPFAQFAKFFGGRNQVRRGNTKAKFHAILSVASTEISILGILFFLSLAARIFLERFELLYRGTGVAYGAGYTDIKVTLNVYIVLMALAVIAAIMIPVAISRKKVLLAAIFPVLMVAVYFAGTGIASLVQNLVVAPDELSKESKYLENNIKYTRLAYDLQDISVSDFQPESGLTKEDVLKNMETFSNIRINDFEPAEQFYNQTQSIRSYYTFNDVDVDRYYVNGEYTQVFLSAREIDENRIDDSWLIRHLKYTHGYGVTLSRVDRITSSGEPDMLISSIPPVSQVPEIDMVRPEIYYGESTDTYIIVGTSEDEFDYPKGETNTYCNYEGEGGITLGFLNRILFAIRERNLKILVSTNIDSDSRILINRNIAERVQKIAPFLTYDDDPYVVTADGKVYWILDAYTTSAYYPYSEPWSKNSDMNYIRNSVKIVVDAYNGTTDFYIIGEDDPIAQTLSRIYPKLFKPIDQMPASLKSHLQYPNALFNIQADVYEKYHMTDVGVFYQNEDLWQISHELYGHSEAQMTPNYFIMKLPGEEKAEFVSTIPYSPSGKSNMSGILTARSDGDNYGQLVLFRMPKDRLIYGPAQIEAQINQDVEISKEFALWDNAGSTYSRGNMFVIPVENSIFYVEPVYLEAATGSLPEVKRVIMYYGDLVAYESTLAECLDSLFGEGAGAPLLTANPIESGKQMAEELANQPVESEPGPDDETPPDEGNEEPTPPDVTIPDDIDEKTVKEIAAYAVDAYRKAVEAQKNGDWAAYGEYITQLGVYLDQIAGDLPIEEPAEGEEGAPEDGAAETGEGESSAEGNEETGASQEGD